MRQGLAVKFEWSVNLDIYHIAMRQYWESDWAQHHKDYFCRKCMDTSAQHLQTAQCLYTSTVAKNTRHLAVHVRGPDSDSEGSAPTENSDEFSLEAQPGLLTPSPSFADWYWFL